MAIVNVTPDSFSGDGSLAHHAVVDAAIGAIDSGADILDLGAESTRPNATPVSSDEEQARLLPVLEAVVAARPEAVISVDTYHAATARAALGAGAEIVNDVSGLLWDEAMPALIAEAQPGLVLMHTRGRPQQWAALTPLPDSYVVPSVLNGLRERLAFAATRAVPRAGIVIDPGFGFGKRGTENMALLGGLADLSALGYPLLVGVSRKGFLGEAVARLQPTGLPPATARLNATMAANVVAILSGAHIIRVHDLQPAREAAAIADAMLG